MHVITSGTATTTPTTSSTASALCLQPARAVSTALPASLEMTSAGSNWVEEGALLILVGQPGIFVVPMLTVVVTVVVVLAHVSVTNHFNRRRGAAWTVDFELHEKHPLAHFP